MEPLGPLIMLLDVLSSSIKWSWRAKKDVDVAPTCFTLSIVDHSRRLVSNLFVGKLPWVWTAGDHSTRIWCDLFLTAASSSFSAAVIFIFLQVYFQMQLVAAKKLFNEWMFLSVLKESCLCLEIVGFQNCSKLRVWSCVVVAWMEIRWGFFWAFSFLWNFLLPFPPLSSSPGLYLCPSPGMLAQVLALDFSTVSLRSDVKEISFPFSFFLKRKMPILVSLLLVTAAISAAFASPALSTLCWHGQCCLVQTSYPMCCTFGSGSEARSVCAYPGYPTEVYFTYASSSIWTQMATLNETYSYVHWRIYIGGDWYDDTVQLWLNTNTSSSNLTGKPFDGKKIKIWIGRSQKYWSLFFLFLKTTFPLSDIGRCEGKTAYFRL